MAGKELVGRQGNLYEIVGGLWKKGRMLLMVRGLTDGKEMLCVGSSLEDAVASMPVEMTQDARVQLRQAHILEIGLNGR